METELRAVLTDETKNDASMDVSENEKKRDSTGSLFRFKGKERNLLDYLVYSIYFIMIVLSGFASKIFPLEKITMKLNLQGIVSKCVGKNATITISNYDYLKNTTTEYSNNYATEILANKNQTYEQMLSQISEIYSLSDLIGQMSDNMSSVSNYTLYNDCSYISYQQDLEDTLNTQSALLENYCLASLNTTIVTNTNALALTQAYNDILEVYNNQTDIVLSKVNNPFYTKYIALSYSIETYEESINSYLSGVRSKIFSIYNLASSLVNTANYLMNSLSCSNVFGFNVCPNLCDLYPGTCREVLSLFKAFLSYDPYLAENPDLTYLKSASIDLLNSNLTLSSNVRSTSLLPDSLSRIKLVLNSLSVSLNESVISDSPSSVPTQLTNYPTYIGSSGACPNGFGLLGSPSAITASCYAARMGVQSTYYSYICESSTPNNNCVNGRCSLNFLRVLIPNGNLDILDSIKIGSMLKLSKIGVANAKIGDVIIDLNGNPSFSCISGLSNILTPYLVSFSLYVNDQVVNSISMTYYVNSLQSYPCTINTLTCSSSYVPKEYSLTYPQNFTFSGGILESGNDIKNRKLLEINTTNLNSSCINDRFLTYSILDQKTECNPFVNVSINNDNYKEQLKEISGTLKNKIDNVYSNISFLSPNTEYLSKLPYIANSTDGFFLPDLSVNLPVLDLISLDELFKLFSIFNFGLSIEDIILPSFFYSFFHGIYNLIKYYSGGYEKDLIRVSLVEQKPYLFLKYIIIYTIVYISLLILGTATKAIVYVLYANGYSLNSFYVDCSNLGVELDYDLNYIIILPEIAAMFKIYVLFSDIQSCLYRSFSIYKSKSHIIDYISNGVFITIEEGRLNRGKIIMIIKSLTSIISLILLISFLNNDSNFLLYLSYLFKTPFLDLY